MMRQTEQQWKELQKKIKIPDPVIGQNEVDRKRISDLEIELAVNTIRNRQSEERWGEELNLAKQPKYKKSGIWSKLGAMLWSAILAWWHSPRKQGGAFEYAPEQRPARKTRSTRKLAPIRLKKKAWVDPDYEDGPNFGDSAFNRQFGGSPFGKGPRF
jgi:hypothetical protein